MIDLSAVGRLVELTAVIVLIGGAIYAAFGFALDLLRRRADGSYDRLRATLGRSILLGLEVLIIADIIETVAVQPTRDNLYVLGLIILIRTFLSFALEVEISGRMPWKRQTE